MKDFAVVVADTKKFRFHSLLKDLYIMCLNSAMFFALLFHSFTALKATLRKSYCSETWPANDEAIPWVLDGFGASIPFSEKDGHQSHATFCENFC